jgi:hypothetical protein
MKVNIPFRFSGLPLISIKNFFNISKHKEDLLNEILDQMKNDGRQVKLKSNKVLSKIYQNFLDYSQNRFGKLDIIKEPEMWALCTNKDNWKSVVHNHIETSTINAVYYLNIPQLNYKNVGDIKLLHNNKWYNYTPSENELIIFPNYLTHDTEFNKTDDFRVSINMEIKCNNEINWSL